MKRLIIATAFILLLHNTAFSQTTGTAGYFANDTESYPSLKVYDAKINSLDAAAKGAQGTGIHRSFLPVSG